MKIKRIGDQATTDGTAERESRLYADRMEALVQAQRILANSQASIDELVDRIPELALNVVAASGAMFELLDGEVTIIRAASAAVTSLAVLGTRWPLAPSLGGEAIRLGTTVRCDDAEDDPRVAKTICRKLGARSIVVVVVRDKAGPIGLLKLFDSQPSRFGASAAHSLELLAEALGAVLQRKRAEADSERMLRVQSGIVALQQEMASASTDLHASMLLVAERAQTLTGADGAAIALVDGDDIVNHVGTGVASGRVGWRLKRGGSLGGLSLERGEVLCCQDSEVDVRVSREDFRGFGLRSAIVAPLRVGGELAGALRVVCARANVFAEIDVSTVQILAQWLGTVMQRAADADQLRTSEAQYRTLFAAHPVPIWVYDLDSLHFLAVNDSAVAHYGYSREEFLSMTLRDVRTPVANQLLDAELTKLRNDPRAIGIGQHRRKDGTNVDVEVYPSTITFGRHAARVALIQDVTERRKAELSIRKSEWLLKIAGRAARVGGWSMDHETKSFSWSDQLSEIHDLPPGTACTTEQALRFYTPESRLTIRDAVLALGRSGTSFDLELELTTAVGRRIWVRSMGEAVRDAAGTIIGTQGAVQDISERKLAEQATRTLATRLTTMLDSIADAFYTLDRDWRFTYINADAERMIERSRADLLGRVIWEAIPGLVGTEFHRQYHDAVRARVAITAESYYEPWQQWLEVHAYPSDDGLTVHFRDVSERREAQAALKLLNQGLEVKVLQRTRELELANVALVSKEQEMRAVVEHMADGVVTFADDGTLRSANPKVEAIFGHSPAALIGRHVSILIPALLDLGTGDDAAAVSGIEDSIAAVGGEAYGRRLTGDAISLDIAFGAYHIGGQRLWTAIVRDIGERVRTLTALKEARHDAEEASRAKSAFVATMSHEIRTPMNGVIGMIDVLHQTELAPDQTRMLAVARDSAHALLGVIEDILDFSKIEAGRVELERLAFSVKDLVQNVGELVAGLALGKSVSLDIDAGAAPDVVWGDPGRLRQVLVNLLGNAIKFSTGRVGARVQLRAQVSERAADRLNIQVQVEDNGVGMDAPTIARLFVPFSQGDASTTRRFGGTGLGLAISHHLVQLMGGFIEVRSTPGVGSVFTVALPFFICANNRLPVDVKQLAAGPQPVRIAAAGSARTPLQSGLVLVAEDHEMNRCVIAEQLKRLGYAAEMAENGVEALRLWRTGRFDVLLTDLRMPEMDGYTLAAAIRAEENGQLRMPIIALTANALKEEAGRCEAAGMDGYMTKPVTMAALGATLKEHFEAAGVRQ